MHIHTFTTSSLQHTQSHLDSIIWQQRHRTQIKNKNMLKKTWSHHWPEIDSVWQQNTTGESWERLNLMLTVHFRLARRVCKLTAQSYRFMRVQILTATLYPSLSTHHYSYSLFYFLLCLSLIHKPTPLFLGLFLSCSYLLGDMVDRYPTVPSIIRSGLWNPGVTRHQTFNVYCHS